MRAALASVLGLSLAFAPMNPARASNPGTEATDEVQTLHELGATRFDVGDYDEALILWKRAFVLLPHTEPTLRPVLVADILAAHARAYEVGRNPEHLAEAMRVIDLRKAEIERFRQAAPGETDMLDARRAEIAQLHETALSRGEPPSELADGMALRIEAPPPPALSGREREAALATDDELGRQFRCAKRMADAGFVVMIFGVAATPTYFLFTGWAFDPKDGVYQPVPHLVPIAAFLGATSIIGGTLFGVGKKRMNQIAAKYEARPDLTPVPLSLAGGGGFGFIGRF